MAESIPSVGLDSSYDQISEAIASVGFLSVENPPVPSVFQVDRMFEISRDFFLHEGDEEKNKVGYQLQFGL